MFERPLVSTVQLEIIVNGTFTVVNGLRDL